MILQTKNVTRTLAKKDHVYPNIKSSNFSVIREINNAFFALQTDP